MKILLRRKLIETILNYNGNTLNYYETMNKMEWSTEKVIKRITRLKIDKLLEHSYNNVPYYKALFDKINLVSDGKINVNDFEKIPFMTKEVLKDEFENLKSKDLPNRKWNVNTSGGSTGVPAKFIQDKEYIEWRSAVKFFYDKWTGRYIGDKQIKLWGAERDINISKGSVTTNKIKKFIKQERDLNAYKMSISEMQNYVKAINEFKPKQILAYVESIHELSKFIENEKLEIHSPDSIMTTAGTLFPDVREKIESVFRTKTFNRYGSREVGDIACECSEQSGLHVSPFTHYVEIVNEEGITVGANEEGQIVVTSLTNFAMPIIRYKIGDIGQWSIEKCRCGRNFPLLNKVSGRITDNFTTIDGTKVYGGFIRKIFYSKSWILKYQIIQEDYEKIVIKIIKDTSFYLEKVEQDTETDNIKESIKEFMGINCVIDIIFVDEIPSNATGKYRYTISLVN
ncbi:phenylacetate--CoA ligase family protein [Evansella tamaricis]|uniref:Uncharacterized protein n=1 Tax=Evansella tamaricis TaxID=2069301 RepID=A0ABS6JJC5_9BACI|nr:hypothetical protein [Evansella tamaricis]MBU9713490.1 hypothetical protein [Evansella tamaricis]